MPHPNDALILAYAQGRLPLAEAGSLESHLEACEECGAKLASAGADTFSDLLRESTTKIQLTPAPLPDLPAGLQNHSRYEITEKLGRGGMGVVYKAVHRMMHRPVALKLIRPDLLASPEAVERFRREVRAAAKLAHPNIVTAYDAEEVAGVHFLVMEYVDGKTLDAIVRKKGPLPLAAACHLARQAALGLEHAHSHGMVHRDIKPQNLILAEKSKVKILDFGLALMRGGTEPGTREGQALGTLLYAAPEQRQSAGSVDARADQYSLGATLAYLLTGTVPSKTPTWPDSIPAEVQKILNRLLAKDPNERYPSMKAVAEALAPWCSRRESATPSRKYVLVAAVAVAVVAAIAWAATRDRSSKTASVSASVAPQKVWKSLLPLDPNAQRVGGGWRMVHGELLCDASLGARIAVPAELPPEYDLRVSFTRKSGIHSVGMIVVQNGRQVVFELDTWEQHLAGFQNVNNQSLRERTPRVEIPLDNNRRYTMLVEVRRESVRGSLEGREVASLRTDGRDLSIDPRYWAMPNVTLGLVAWNSEVTFHSIDISNP